MKILEKIKDKVTGVGLPVGIAMFIFAVVADTESKNPGTLEKIGDWLVSGREAFQAGFSGQHYPNKVVQYDSLNTNK